MIGSAIAELLQAVNGACVYPGRAHEPKYPVIVFAMARHERSLNIDAGNSGMQTESTSFDIDVLSKTYTEGEQIALSLMNAYHGWSGAVSGVQIALIELQADAVVYEDAEGVWAFPFGMTVHH